MLGQLEGLHPRPLVLHVRSDLLRRQVTPRPQLLQTTPEHLPVVDRLEVVCSATLHGLVAHVARVVPMLGDPHQVVLQLLRRPCHESLPRLLAGHRRLVVLPVRHHQRRPGDADCRSHGGSLQHLWLLDGLSCRHCHRWWPSSLGGWCCKCCWRCSCGQSWRGRQRGLRGRPSSLKLLTACQVVERIDATRHLVPLDPRPGGLLSDLRGRETCPIQLLKLGPQRLPMVDRLQVILGSAGHCLVANLAHVVPAHRLLCQVRFQVLCRAVHVRPPKLLGAQGLRVVHGVRVAGAGAAACNGHALDNGRGLWRLRLRRQRCSCCNRCHHRRTSHRRRHHCGHCRREGSSGAREVRRVGAEALLTCDVVEPVASHRGARLQGEELRVPLEILRAPRLLPIEALLQLAPVLVAPDVACHVGWELDVAN
mmetsp:Transcript_145759/g.363474  ORF Transcript_145759/g.363474 Transcript_145759/m.363474 type:complete len:423 (-) Transcript_145759:276-1544(-)